MSTAPVLTVLEAFAGIGGMTLGLERAGFDCVGLIEKDPFCRAVLARHWPRVPQHDEIKTAAQWWQAARRPRVDLVAGGYPCQPESLAGRRLGNRDPRWLWPWYADLIDLTRPRAVLCENVIGHRTRGLPTVLGDLARLGYVAAAGVLRACEVGAPHARPRLFVVAYANGEYGAARLGTGNWGAVPAGGRGESPWRDLPRGLASIAGDSGVADGVSRRVDRSESARIRALGNAVVPAAAELMGRIIKGQLCRLRGDVVGHRTPLVTTDTVR